MNMKRKNNLSRQLRDEPINKKKLTLRLVLFVIFLGLAGFFIYRGITSLGQRRTEGLQVIEAEQDKEIPYYQLGVSFRHWFSGSSSSIKMAVGELNKLYAETLKDAYCALDPVNEYPGRTNLATVNQNLGREISVPRNLYEALKEADAMTRSGTVYNVYAGAFYGEWEDLRYLLDPLERDPVHDPEEAERLERLGAATAELSNFSLEFLDDETCRLRFTVDQSYLDLLAELELSELPILDFNVLRDAWKLELVAERLEARGYDRGYLTTDTGLTLALSGYTDGGDYCFFGQQEGFAVPAATLAIQPGSRAAQLRAFGLVDEAGYYVLEGEDGDCLRHPWLPADGRFRELVLSCFASGTEKLPALCLDCLRLYACDTEAEAKTLAASLPACALLLRSAPQTVWISDPALLPAAAYGYESGSLR